MIPIVCGGNRAGLCSRSPQASPAPAPIGLLVVVSLIMAGLFTGKRTGRSAFWEPCPNRVIDPVNAARFTTAASTLQTLARSAALNASCAAKPSRIGTPLGCLDIGSSPVQPGNPTATPNAPRTPTTDLKFGSRLFGLAGRRPFLIFHIWLPLRRDGYRLQKSGGPALFALSLKLQRDNHAHTHSGCFLSRQLPGAVGAPMGATVSRKRTEQIFCKCWNLITPGCHATASIAM